uniref:hypothetical protein n=1 Tax=Flavobacterium sp. TaxID=239 RepID=UPI00404A98DB
MSNNRMPPGCAAIILGFIGIWAIYDHFITAPRAEEKEKKELIEKWTKPTVDFFSNFNCSDFKPNNNVHKIEKFFVIESHLDHPCQISKYSKTDEIFSNANYINKFYTKNISEANTIIWIQSIGGSSEGNYTDSSPAKRLIAVINFIDKETKTIYKKEKKEFSGNPRNEITRSNRDKKGTNVYFGEMPYDEIFAIIENELKK